MLSDQPETQNPSQPILNDHARQKSPESSEHSIASETVRELSPEDRGQVDEVEGTNPVELVALEESQKEARQEDRQPQDEKLKDSQKAYSAFTPKQRWMIVIISSVAGIFR
jgi:hypothetical protein